MPRKSRFSGYFAVRILIFAAVFAQVLALERRTPTKAGQNQQWYEKGWKNSASSNSDAVYIDGARSQRLRSTDGSGAGAVGDLDDTASGFGEDDEDSDDPDPDQGSGDMALPSAHVTPYRPPEAEETTPDASWPSTSTPTTTTTSSAHLLPVFTTTQPSIAFIGPAATITTTPKAASTRYVVETTTSSSSRVMTSSALFTTRSTTTAEPITRRRQTTTTTIATTTTPRESHKPSVKALPPMLDDTNNATPQNFWMRPGVLAGLIGGAVAGLLAAILLVMFVVYRMRKKDEGSYALEEPKSPPAYTYAYQKAPTREFYA